MFRRFFKGADSRISDKTGSGRGKDLAFLRQACLTPVATDQHCVVSLYGVGGQGKSTLIRSFLNEYANADKHLCAVVDFDIRDLREAAFAMMAIRQTFAEQRIPTNAFDIAFARYFTLTSPGRSLKEEYPTLFEGESNFLSEVYSFIGTAISDIIPGGGLLVRAISKLSSSTRDWIKEARTTILDPLDDMSASEVRKILPRYLAYDLQRYITSKKPGKHFLLIFDSYEKLGADRPAGARAIAENQDSWVKDFVCDMPGATFLISGRNRLIWNDMAMYLPQGIAEYALGALTPEECEAILQGKGMTDPDLIGHIVSVAGGHALSVVLMAEIWQRLTALGRAPEISDFPASQAEVLGRFIGHVDDNTLDILRILSLPSTITLDFWNEMVSLGRNSFLSVNRDIFLSQAFFSQVGPETYALHQILRDHLTGHLQQETPQLLTELRKLVIKAFENTLASETERTKSVGLTNTVLDTTISEILAQQQELGPEALLAWAIHTLEETLRVGNSPMRVKIIAAACEAVSGSMDINASDLISLSLIAMASKPFASISIQTVETVCAQLENTNRHNKDNDESIISLASLAQRAFHDELAKRLLNAQDLLNRRDMPNLSSLSSAVVSDLIYVYDQQGAYDRVIEILDHLLTQSSSQQIHATANLANACSRTGNINKLVEFHLSRREGGKDTKESAFIESLFQEDASDSELCALIVCEELLQRQKYQDAVAYCDGICGGNFEEYCHQRKDRLEQKVPVCNMLIGYQYARRHIRKRNSADPVEDLSAIIHEEEYNHLIVTKDNTVLLPLSLDRMFFPSSQKDIQNQKKQLRDGDLDIESLPVLAARTDLVLSKEEQLYFFANQSDPTISIRRSEFIGLRGDRFLFWIEGNGAVWFGVRLNPSMMKYITPDNSVRMVIVKDDKVLYGWAHRIVSLD